MDVSGQPFEPPMQVFSSGRGDRPVARSARRLLRKPVEASEKRASPADAFCAQAPCPRATTQASRNCQSAAGGPQPEPGFYLKEITDGIPFMRLLVIEDEKKVARFIKKGLGEEGYAVDLAFDGEEGLAMVLDQVHDLIILDIALPKIDGLQVLKKLRERNVRTPVLLLTVRATIEDKVLGLDSGADDYLTKPFVFQELLARIRALLRRKAEAGPPLLQVEDLVLDPARHLVTRGGERVDLTSKEFALLEYLLRNAGRVLSRAMISEHVWNYDFDTETNVIDVYVNYLRRKIDSGRDKKLIHTVRGSGYVLKSE
jgi:two-component system copper resistance phosphate regulon response regulator CusR